MSSLNVELYPFYGTQFKDNTANFGQLPIPCVIENEREALVGKIAYMMFSLSPICKTHSDYRVTEEEYFEHLCSELDTLGEMLNLPKIDYKTIFDDVWSTTHQKNTIYLKYGREYEDPEIMAKLATIERCLGHSKDKLTDGEISEFYIAFCDYVLTHSSAFLVTNCLPLLELVLLFKENCTIRTVETEDTLTSYSHKQEPIKLSYTFQDLCINIFMTYFKRFICVNTNWIYIRYMTDLLFKDASKVLSQKRNDDIDWHRQARKIITHFVNNNKMVKPMSSILLSTNSSEEAVENLVHKLYTRPGIQESVIEELDLYNPIITSNWRYLQYPHMLLMCKSRLKTLIITYVYVLNKVINKIIKSENNTDLFKNEENLHNRAGTTLKNLIAKIIDKNIITADYWDMLRKSDTQFMIKILTALFREDVVKSITRGDMNKFEKSLARIGKTE